MPGQTHGPRYRIPDTCENPVQLFIGGSNLVAGQELFKAVQKMFFADFRVSIMLDSNGSNTTAAAGVAKLGTSGTLAGKKAVILAGTGPVGQRAAVMLAKEGCQVSLTSRTVERGQKACQDMKARFGVDLGAIAAPDNESRGKAIEHAQIVFAAGAAGAELLQEHQWRENPNVEMMADANATPPLGIAGTDMLDRGNERHGKIIWGAIGFGTLKLAVHRACIAKLFESNKQIFDAEEIFETAKAMA